MFWIIMTAVAGFGLGAFGIPMKLTKRWKWEHTWCMYAFWALLASPWIIAVSTVPDLFKIYGQVSSDVFLLVCLFGTLWGIANITFGLGLSAMGLSLGYSIMLGLIIVFGAIMPLVFNSKTELFSRQNIVLMSGLLVMLISLAINLIAAFRRDRELSVENIKSGQVSILKGLVYCFITGLFAVGLNYGFIYGEPIQAKAIDMGVSASRASNAILPVIFIGACLITMLYCGIKIHMGRTWQLFFDRTNRGYFALTAFMAIWTVGVAVFGVAAANMGKLGHSAGWAVLNASAIIWANIIGIISGEWKGVSRKTVGVFMAGLVVMLAGIIVVGWANALE